jgi:hypothetical protein
MDGKDIIRETVKEMSGDAPSVQSDPSLLIAVDNRVIELERATDYRFAALEKRVTVLEQGHE